MKFRGRTYSIQWRTIISIVLLVIAVQILTTAIASTSYAAPLPSAPRGTCSDDPDFKIEPAPPGGGIITRIVNLVQGVLNTVSMSMYNGIVGDGGFSSAVKAAAILYLAISGIMFTAGTSQVTVADLTVRGVKVSIVAVLISPSSWAFFNGYVVHFFNQGTNDLINAVSAIAVNGIPMGGPPFAPLDDAIMKALSTKMLVTIMATFFTGPYGVIFGLILLSGLGSFLKSVINAMWVYMMAMVLKALMFGVAPLFIPMVLFNRTKHLFDGWLNQVVNACLQPIMLFAFFAFFVKLIAASIDLLLQTPVCWSGWSESLRGSPFNQHWWRFTAPDPDTGRMMPFTGIWSFTGRAGGGPVFPIDIMVILIFMMLCEMAARFNAVVIEIAKDISGAATNLSGMAGGIQEWFSSSGGAQRPGEGGAGRPENIGGRAPAPGRPGAPGAPARGGNMGEQFRDAIGRALGARGGPGGAGGAGGNPFAGIRVGNPGANVRPVPPPGVGVPGGAVRDVRERIAGLPPRRL